jgi:3-deoxy-7-phosphoheptulonate synthase
MVICSQEASKKYPLVDIVSKKGRLPIEIEGKYFGVGHPFVIAGPCAIETEEQLEEVASLLSKLGVPFLRGGAFKPRTSPYSFQGLGKVGLKLMHEAAKRHQLLTVSEVMNPGLIEELYPFVDLFQVGSRNMQNFCLLKELGKIDKPVLLKRGFAATYEDFLSSAEYILNGGNEKVILCERGIRTFETYTRNTLDLTAIPALQELTHLPVIVDPSHGTGYSRFVAPMSKAALSAGADGLMIEVHPHPSQSLSDPDQALSLTEFEALYPVLKALMFNDL